MDLIDLNTLQNGLVERQLRGVAGVAT